MWYEDLLVSEMGVLISADGQRYTRLSTLSALLVWTRQPCTRQVLVFNRKGWWEGCDVAEKSYLMGVGSMSHPCFANWRVHKGEEGEKMELTRAIQVQWSREVSSGQNNFLFYTELFEEHIWVLTEGECQSLPLDLLQHIWAAVCVEDHERRGANPLI